MTKQEARELAKKLTTNYVEGSFGKIVEYPQANDEMRADIATAIWEAFWAGYYLKS